jgi:cellulose synthase/poly-beta-1,6-N-acetylglucosamine synthase-like glycosyltransferase
VDRDCLPEDDWLRRLLEPLREPTVDVVTSNGYID